MQTKNCLFCKKIITKPINESQKAWENRHKYCSRECSNKYRKDKPIHSKEFIESVRKRMKGNKYTLGKKPWHAGTKGLVGAWNKGKFCEQNARWKGDKAGVRAKHQWIERRLGKAKDKNCELCGKKGCQWSNKDHKYTRDLKDWWALCYKCHQEYDIKHNDKFSDLKINFKG